MAYEGEINIYTITMQPTSHPTPAPRIVSSKYLSIDRLFIRRGAVPPPPPPPKWWGRLISKCCQEEEYSGWSL